MLALVGWWLVSFYMIGWRWAGAPPIANLASTVSRYIVSIV